MATRDLNPSSEETSSSKFSETSVDSENDVEEKTSEQTELVVASPHNNVTQTYRARNQEQRSMVEPQHSEAESETNPRSRGK